MWWFLGVVLAAVATATFIVVVSILTKGVIISAARGRSIKIAAHAA